MRHTPARTLLVAAALAIGLAWLTQAGAADPPTDDEFKTLVDQDAKVIAKAADAVAKAATEKDKKAVIKNAGPAIKSSAVILGGYANARITGKDPAADAKAAAVRDAAVRIYKAAADGDFKTAATEAAGLSSLKPAAGGKPAKMDTASLIKAFPELTSKEVMHNFHTTRAFGTNVEADIKANAEKKGTAAKPAETAAMAQRVLVMGEYSKAISKTSNDKEKKEWDQYNEKMMKATEDLLAAAKKKSGPADMVKAFTAVNASCVRCHDDFKKD